MISISRLPKVLDHTGFSRSALYAAAANGTFTKPIKIGLRSAGWPDHEIEEINVARIAGKTDDEIRELVIGLEAARKVSAGGSK